MLNEPARTFRLTNEPGGMGLSCGPEGLALAGVPLLQRVGDGLAARSPGAVRYLLNRAYTGETDVPAIMRGIGSVARSLNQGDMARAMTAAVLLKLPELGWHGAVRVAQADDLLAKYDPNEPRDSHGRWTTGSGSDSPSTAPPEMLGGNAEISVPQDTPPPPAGPLPNASASHGIVATRPDDPFRIPHDWARLPPGNYVDETADFLQWIANCKDENEASDIADEIDHRYQGIGDFVGNSAMYHMLSDVLHSDGSLGARQAILDRNEPLAHTEPEPASQLLHDLIQSVMPPGVPGTTETEEPPPEDAPSPLWRLGWGARGMQISKAFGENLAHNFPAIDRFLDGVATSIKSMDLTAGTYQSGTRLMARLNSYVDSLAEFDGAELGDEVVMPGETQKRILNLVIPKGRLTDVQRAAIEAARARAKTLNVDLVVNPF